MQHGGVVGHWQSAFEGPQGLNVIEIPALQHALHSRYHTSLFKPLGRGFRLSGSSMYRLATSTDHRLDCMVFSCEAGCRFAGVCDKAQLWTRFTQSKHLQGLARP